jgi:hypothetical protein
MATVGRASNASSVAMPASQLPIPPKPQYTFSSLANPSTDIRLVTILPGESADDICVRIDDARLIVPAQHESPTAMTRVDVQRTLPRNWNARQTTGGDFIFLNRAAGINTWHHPDPQLDLRHGNRPETTFEPAFEALSYVWGPPEEVSGILIQSASDGSPTTSYVPMEVRRNLADALRYLRCQDKPRVMWIDAICINQSDLNERSEQVRRMVDIYKFARRVVVWLGTEARESDLAMKTVQHIGRQMVFLEGGRAHRSPEATEAEWYSAHFILPYNLREWRAIQLLVERPWFSRLWVWQEIYLANGESIVQCGSTVVLWKLFNRGLSGIEGKMNKTIHHFGLRKAVGGIRSLLGDHYVASFRDVMEWSRIRETSDAKDKVYGILGIVDPSFAKEIVPQYATSRDEVYRDTFLAHLRFSEQMDLLPQCELDKRSSGPSWVPDWFERKSNRSFEYLYSASGARSRSETKYTPPNMLEVSGICCATVAASVSLRVDTLGATRVKLNDILAKLKHQGRTIYPTGQTLEDAIAATFCANLIAARFPDTAEAKNLQDWKNTLFGTGAVKEEESILDEPVPHFLNFTYARLLFMTDEGYVGLGPLATQEGTYSDSQRTISRTI